jgi:DNA-directed RNA polymerase subunit beta
VIGTVIGAQVFSRKGVDKDERTLLIEEQEEHRLLKDQDATVKILRSTARERILKLLSGKPTAAALIDDKGSVLVESGQQMTEAMVAEVPEKYWTEIRLDGGSETEELVARVSERLEADIAKVRKHTGDRIDRLKKGDELSPGVIKMVKVYLAIKRKLKVGDKMAGRHGNKGVVSRILPEEDMPYMADGTPVDVVLNPLGVPSRMNVGQILETHLGMAAREMGRTLNKYLDENWNSDKLREVMLTVYTSDEQQAFVNGLDDDGVKRFIRSVQNGIHVATPVFDGAKETDIHELFAKVGWDKSGQMVLFDGRTGEAFDQDVTVGVMSC